MLNFVQLELVLCHRLSLCSPGWPGTHCVDQAASGSWLLGFKAIDVRAMASLLLSLASLP